MRHTSTRLSFTHKGGCSFSYTKETRETPDYPTPSTFAHSSCSCGRGYGFIPPPVVPPQGPYPGHSYYQPPMLPYQPARAIMYPQQYQSSHNTYNPHLVRSRGPYSEYSSHSPVIPYHSSSSISSSQPYTHPPTIYNPEPQRQFGRSDRGSSRVSSRSASPSPDITTGGIQSWVNTTVRSNTPPPNEPQDLLGGARRGLSRAPSRSAASSLGVTTKEIQPSVGGTVQSNIPSPNERQGRSRGSSRGSSRASLRSAVSNPGVTTQEVQLRVSDSVQDNPSPPSSRRPHSAHPGSTPDLVYPPEGFDETQNEEGSWSGSEHPPSDHAGRNRRSRAGGSTAGLVPQPDYAHNDFTPRGSSYNVAMFSVYGQFQPSYYNSSGP